MPDRDGSRKERPEGLEGREAAAAEHGDGGGSRFPVRAFAQMCLRQPSSELRLESHVVETLVLGSADTDTNIAGAKASLPSSSAGGNSSGSCGGADSVDMASLYDAKRNGLEAICEFHGADGWSWVDRAGLIAGGVVNGVGVDNKTESSLTWQEAVWHWYDARF